MKLVYRGVPYEFNRPSFEMVDVGITARYRRVPYAVRCPQLSQGEAFPLTLKYRGVAYPCLQPG